MEIWPQILLGGVVAGVLAQVISGRLSRSVKISEFRQKWIDSLRDDVAAYVGATHKWVRKYEEVNVIVEFEKKGKKEGTNCFRCKTTLWSSYRGSSCALTRTRIATRKKTIHFCAPSTSCSTSES